VRPTDPASAARSAAVETSVVDVPADLHLRQLATLLGLVSGVQAVTLFAVLALPTLATKAAPAFGVGAEAVGYQISLIYIIASLVSSFAGLYVRRYGAATTSFAAVAMAAISLAGFASGDLAVAALCSIICGAAYGITNPAASHLLWRFAPPARRNLVFAIKQTGTPLGGMLASLLLPALSMWLGWRGAILASLILFVVIALPLLLKRPVWDEDRDPGARIRGSLFTGVRAALGHPTLRGLAIVGLSYAGYQFCLFSFVVTMLVVDFEWSLISAGWMATAMQIGGVSGRIGWSMLADRIGRGIELLAVIGLLATALGVLVATMTTAWPAYAIMVVLFLFGFCLVGWNGLFMAEAARAAGPANVGVATGGVLVFTFAGIVIGPAAFATVYKLASSYALTYGIFALAPLIGVAALIPVLRRR
jgi:predicted MFS family arabinose efflux permease